MRNLALLCLLPFVVACPPSEEDDDFVGGNFAFDTTAVTDACNDGALAVIFLPEGAGTTNRFADAIYIPGTEELPFDGTIALQDPFQDLSVTMTGDATSLTFAGAVNDDIFLDEENYADCTVDLVIDADCTIDSADEVSCTAILSMSDVQGDTCPVMDSDPCDVTLTILGTRNAG